MSWYTPIGGPAMGLARGLYSDGSTLSGAVGPHDTARAKATRCGVQSVAPNYVQSRDMGAFVWTWAAGEPAAGGDCVVQRADGFWAAQPCAAAAALPPACRAAADDRKWQLAGRTAGAAEKCAAGFVARPPTNRYANALLQQAAAGGRSTGDRARWTAGWVHGSLEGAGS